MRLYYFILVIIFLPFILFAQSNTRRITSPETTYSDFKTLNSNNILIRVNNSGGLEEYDGDNYGAEWNQIEFDEKVIVWDQGIWVVGKIDDQPHLALSQYRSSYIPGPIVDGEPVLIKNPEDSLKYRVYRISNGDDNSNPDYAEWPGDLGAPVDSEGKPVVYGNQTLWTVFNSFDENNEYRQWWNETHDTLPPMPVEAQELVYAREGNYPDSIDIFSNVVFFEYTIVNKGEKQIDSAFISLWSDIDFGILSKNYPAIDTSLQTAYLWSDYEEAGTSPAVGYTMLYGPKISSVNDSAIYRGKRIKNYKNIDLFSFFGIPDNNAIEPIFRLSHSWNIARGLHPYGMEWYDPYTNKYTKFPLSGDPVKNEGWIYNQTTGTGAGFNIFTGPFTLAPQDTQWVMFALVPGLGKTNLESITNMRKKVSVLRSMEYDSLAFGSSPIIVDVKKNSNNIKDYRLSQNFPNPFNPSTTIKYSVPDKGLVQLKVFDILGNEIETLINEEKPAGSYEVKFNAVNLTSGVYFTELRAEILPKPKRWFC